MTLRDRIRESYEHLIGAYRQELVLLEGEGRQADDPKVEQCKRQIELLERLLDRFLSQP